ncbi:MAG: class I SAM-dependent methyltransferase [Nanoarchaeota archaeon]|nr:class I SAM-dependent methyltransferase [Nanoarchaeota archaeon]
MKERLDRFPSGFRFLDAGGGTGRWSKKILENYPLCNGILIDFSKEMLAQAKNKNQYGKRWTIKRGNIYDLKYIKAETVDIVINTHNVLGFVKNTMQALLEMKRVLKNNGLLVSVIPNKYHGIYFNLLLGNLEGAESIKNNSGGKFVEDMPEIHMFSPASIKAMYKEAGFGNIVCWGFPICIYPGYNETREKGNSIQAEKSIAGRMEQVFNIENSLIRDEALAARGNNLFVVGYKQMKQKSIVRAGR